MCSQTIDFTELYSKISRIWSLCLNCSSYFTLSSVKSTEFFSYPKFPNYSVILQEQNFSVYDLIGHTHL